MDEWQHEHVRERPKRRLRSPQKRALDKRAKQGLSPATSALTQERVSLISDYIRDGVWSKDVMLDLAKQWMLSVKRVQQMAAEAKRHG